MSIPEFPGENKVYYALGLLLNTIFNLLPLRPGRSKECFAIQGQGLGGEGSWLILDLKGIKFGCWG